MSVETNLIHQLSLLYANAGQTLDQQAWQGLRLRAHAGQLLSDDWENIHRMFQAVIRDGVNGDDKWFQYFSRWFGTADHTLGLYRPSDSTRPHPSSMGLEQDSMPAVDALKYGALVLAYTLGVPFEPLQTGLSRYVTLNPDLRTHFVDDMLTVEQILNVCLHLKPEEVTPEVQQKLKEPLLRRYFERVFVDLKDLLFEHDSLSILLHHAVLNSLYGSPSSVKVYRVHVNMTTINEKDDTNFHGNVFLQAVRSWFQEKFGRVHVVQNPERTTFEFMASSSEMVAGIMADFEIEVRSRIASTPGVDEKLVDPFIPRVIISERIINRHHVYDYAIRTSEDLEAFRSVIEFEHEYNSSFEDLKRMGVKYARHVLKAHPPHFDKIRQSGDPVLIKTLNALVLQAVIELNSALASQTSFFEKEKLSGSIPSKTVYQERDLPSKGTPQYARWRGFYEKKAGYVGPGRYDPSRDQPQLEDAALAKNLFFNVLKGTSLGYVEDPSLSPRVHHILSVVPRLSHEKGRLSHQREGSPGGHLQQFEQARHALALAPSEEIPGRLEAFQKISKELLDAFLNFYRMAITDPRNAWTAKQHRVFPVHRSDTLQSVRSNFFVQEVALAQNSYLAVLEYDSFKAFNTAHAINDDIDSDYNRVRDALFLAAKRMKMPMPIVNPSGGDHLSVSFADVNLHGEVVDPCDYCRQVQQIVREAFQNRPFQDLHKVEMQEMILGFEDGSTLEKLFNSNFQKSLATTFDLSAQVHVERINNVSARLIINAESRSNERISDQKVVTWLYENGLKARMEGSTTKQVSRLPMWKKSGGKIQERNYWYFGREAPSGYEAFKRSLTVTMVLGDHVPLKTAGDVISFLIIEDALGLILGDVKKSSWPFKNSFMDARNLLASGLDVPSQDFAAFNFTDLTPAMIDVGMRPGFPSIPAARLSKPPTSSTLQRSSLPDGSADPKDPSKAHADFQIIDGMIVREKREFEHGWSTLAVEGGQLARKIFNNERELRISPTRLNRRPAGSLNRSLGRFATPRSLTQTRSVFRILR